MKARNAWRLGLAAAGLLLGGGVMASAAQADAPQAGAPGPDWAIGRWLTPSKHGVVTIARCGASICGVLSGSDGLAAHPDLRDIRNADEHLRGRRLLGLTMLQGFHATARGWDGGTIYNPEDGGTYHATVTFTDANTLNLRGCIAWPLCKTQSWHRQP